MGMGMRRVRFLEEGRERRVPGLLYADNFVLYGMSEEHLEIMGVKDNVGKSKVMVLDGEEGFECEVSLEGVRLKHVSEFKYLICILDESGTDVAECHRKVASRRRVESVIRFLVNPRDLKLLEYASLA